MSSIPLCSVTSAGDSIALMTRLPRLAFLASLAACAATSLAAQSAPAFRDLFNGKDLTGWVNVNTDEDTWTVKDGVLICKGKPIGVMRTDRQYENFVLHIEWKHINPGGNSGVFAWSDAKPGEKNRLPNGVEIQMLEVNYITMHKAPRRAAPLAGICSWRLIRRRRS